MNNKNLWKNLSLLNFKHLQIYKEVNKLAEHIIV